MKKPDRRSIYDLATQVGVSASTVSRVLNGRNGIRSTTRQLVLSAARASGFRPTMSARQLSIAVVIDRNQYVTFGGFVSSLVSHIVQVLSGENVAVELVTERSFDRLQSRLLDGVLALAWDDSTVEQLRKLPRIPVVMINRMDADDFSSVVTDHARQGEMAVEYLCKRGHKRIAMVCEERNNWGSLQRTRGFIEAMTRNGLEVVDDCVMSSDHQPMYGVLRRLMSGWRPTGIFVGGEDIGLEASYILRDVLRLKVPQEVSVLGMESARLSQFLSPPMTTLCQSHEELARISVEVLLRQLEAGAEAEQEHIVLQSTLMERESVTYL